MQGHHKDQERGHSTSCDAFALPNNTGHHLLHCGRSWRLSFIRALPACNLLSLRGVMKICHVSLIVMTHNVTNYNSYNSETSAHRLRRLYWCQGLHASARITNAKSSAQISWEPLVWVVAQASNQSWHFVSSFETSKAL